MPRPKVLIVESGNRWQENFVSWLSDKFTLIQTRTTSEAKKLFRANPKLDAIVVNAYLPGEKPTAQDLVKMMRETFQGPIIGISSRKQHREEMIKAGCSHECIGWELEKKLYEIFPAV